MTSNIFEFITLSCNSLYIYVEQDRNICLWHERAASNLVFEIRGP